MNMGFPYLLEIFPVYYKILANAGKRDKICTEEGENFIEGRQYLTITTHPLQGSRKGN